MWIATRKISVRKFCRMRVPKISLSHNSVFAHLLLGGIFIALAGIFILTGFTPKHDAMGWHGAFHYFYTSVERGVMPYWNPYSQTGTPFFNNFQSFGLLLPVQFFWILVQKLTDSSTLTTYILFYFSMYYLFIAGTYCTLNIIIKHPNRSLCFSMTLLLVSFPNFMQQNGALHSFFLFPFITFFLLLFFKEPKGKKKGIDLCMLSFLCALSLNVYIPMWLIFYFWLFVLLVFLFRLADLRNTLQFFSSREGVFWLSLSLLVAFLLLAPVIMLYYELHHEPEMFPTLRFLRVNLNNLVKTYASDLQAELFSEKFTRDLKGSLTLGDLAGLFFAPFQYAFSALEHSEIIIFLGVLPLFCIFLALTHAKQRHYAYVFLIIALGLLGIACNFSVRYGRQAGLTQRIILAIFPFLKMSDVLQNGGTLILFCLIIPGAIGFQHASAKKHSRLWMVSILFFLYKYVLFFPIVRIVMWMSVKHDWIVEGLAGGTFLMFTALVVKLLNTPQHKIWAISHKKNIRGLAITLFIIELLIFEGFQFHPDPAISRQYSNYFYHNNLIYTEPEFSFIHYRVPFSFESATTSFSAVSNPQKNTEGRLFYIFFWPELYHVDKVAFPAVVE